MICAVRAVPAVMFAVLLTSALTVTGDPPPAPPACPCELKILTSACPSEIKVGSPVTVRLLIHVKKDPKFTGECPPVIANGFVVGRNKENQEVFSDNNVQLQGQPYKQTGGKSGDFFLLVVQINDSVSTAVEDGGTISINLGIKVDDPNCDAVPFECTIKVCKEVPCPKKKE